jgi:signal transduction histidine kinase
MDTQELLTEKGDLMAHDSTHLPSTPTPQVERRGKPSGAGELAEALTDFAANLATISDLDHLCSFVAERAIALVGADEGALHLKTRPLSADDSALQLALPLRARGEVLGVLTVARRRPEAEGPAEPDAEASSPGLRPEPATRLRQSSVEPSVESAQPEGFSQEDRRRLTLLASIAAVAIAGIKREQAARRRANWRDRALDLLQETGRVMGSTLELGPLMRRIIDVTVRALHAEAGMLVLLDSNDHLVLRAVAGTIPRDIIGTRIEAGQSIVGWVTRHGRAALVPDPRADPRASLDHPAAAVGFEARALLAAPLVTKGRTIGAVEVANKRDGAFDEGDRHLLEALALSAAGAIENARLYEHMQRQALQQENIIRVGHAMSSAQDVDAVLQEVVESALSVIPTAFTAVVHLLDKEHGELRLHCDAGRPLWNVMKQPFSIGQGIAGHVFATRQLMNVPDVLANPRYILGPGRVVYRSLLVAPLIVEDKPLGTLSVTGLERTAFGRDDEQMIRGLAAQAAVVLHNAQLYTQAEERAVQLQAANRQLQDLAHRKTQFVQNISHELRTPLTFVRGYLELLLSGDLGSLSDRQQGVLEIMDIKSQHLVDLVNDIASLLEVELSPAEVQPVDLMDAVARSVIAQRELANKAGIVLETQWPDVPPIVQGNQHRLTKVFNHLLENAIKFSPYGGHVHVRVWSERGNAFVQVADEGIGIPPDEQEHIFDRFYQVDGSTTRRFGGAGLGLAIVKETIEAHEGTVQVESSGMAGEGTVFTTILPLTQQSNAHKQKT